MRIQSSRALLYRGRPEERWHRQVVRSPDCWDWSGRKSLKGYGYMQVEGKRIYAHRFAWQLAAGFIPKGMVVGHVCDNPSCVYNRGAGLYVVRGVPYPRYGHLWLGTGLANTQDMWDKGRGWREGAAPPGERNGSAKLTRAQVLEIRARWARGGVFQRELGADFGVSQAQISLIVRGLARRHG